MRVSSGQIAQTVINGLSRQGGKYAQVLEQMSTGYRINNIADDPLGSTLLIGLDREQSTLTQYQSNIDSTQSTLQRSESNLNSSLDVMNRVQQLVLQGNNGSYSAEDRQAMAAELESLRDSLINFGNAVDESGHYLFSGSQLDTPAIGVDEDNTPFYQGDSQQRQVQVAAGVQVPGNVSVEQIYFGNNDFLTSLDTYIDELNTIDANQSVPSGASMIDTVNSTMDSLNQTLTDIGSTISSITRLKSAQSDLQLVNDKITGNIRDLDYADAATKVNQIQLTLTATQQTYTRLNNLSLFNYM